MHCKKIICCPNQRYYLETATSGVNLMSKLGMASSLYNKIFYSIDSRFTMFLQLSMSITRTWVEDLIRFWKTRDLSTSPNIAHPAVSQFHKEIHTLVSQKADSFVQKTYFFSSERSSFLQLMCKNCIWNWDLLAIVFAAWKKIATISWKCKYKIDYLEQCFSTGVPRRKSAPWNFSRCAAKSWNVKESMQK